MRITIYTRNDCVQCHATKRAMENRGFDFEMINVDRVPEAAEALRAQGFRQLPVVIAGDLSWSGFRPDMINRLHPATRGQCMSQLVYFSSSSENTQRFIERLGLPAVRIPLNERERIQVDEPYILIVPSYGGGGTAGAVPRQVIRFLNDEHNRALLRGVIASGNRNFGEAYGRAGDVIARKCGVPWLYRFELMGTQSDIENVRKGVTEFWQRQPQNA